MRDGWVACAADILFGYQALSSGKRDCELAGFDVASVSRVGGARGPESCGRYVGHLRGVGRGEHADVHGDWMVRHVRFFASFQTTNEGERPGIPRLNDKTDPEKVLTGRSPHILLILTWVQGLAPAQGSVKPTAGFTFNKVIYPPLFRRLTVFGDRAIEVLFRI